MRHMILFFFSCRSSSEGVDKHGHFISSRIPDIMLSEFNYNRSRCFSALLLCSILCGVTLRTRDIGSAFVYIYTHSIINLFIRA